MSATRGADSGALEAVDRILNRGGPPDEVLRAVVGTLHARGLAWVALVDASGAIRVEAGERPAAPPELRTPIVYRGHAVGELRGSGSPAERPLLERVALLVSAHVT